MKIIQKWYLNYLVKKDKKFLLEQGLKKARENGLSLCLCQSSSCSENKGKEIHLPSYTGEIDTKNLVVFVADDFPEPSKRYLANKEKLSRLVSWPSKV